MTGLTVDVCVACGHSVFPRRVLCPRCGGRDWQSEDAGPAVVEQVTSHRRGGTIASVRTLRGPVVIARAPAGIAPGTEVSLGLDGGAPVATSAGGAPVATSARR